MKLSDMKRVLTEGDIRLTKSLGQNFLHDAHQLDRIMTAAAVTGNDSVLEVGPGLGPLTERLLAQGARVLAIEKDQRLVSLLRNRFQTAPNLELIHGDALDYVRQPRDWREWKLVSNLPYSVASPIIVELALSDQGPLSMTTTLQLEVAQRLRAGAGHPDYGVLSLLVQLSYEPGPLFRIPAGSFFPPPDVDSACISMIRRKTPLLEAPEKKVFVGLVKTSFSQRRKMMFKLLKGRWPVPLLEECFSRLNIDRGVRAEALSLEQLVLMARLIAAYEQQRRNL